MHAIRVRNVDAARVEQQNAAIVGLRVVEAGSRDGF
jgi:hypothetical protein